MYNRQALIKLLGAKNIADYGNYRNVSAESLLAMNPTVILVAGRLPDSAVEELLNAQNVLKYSAAVKSDNIKSIDGSSLVAGLSVTAIKEAIRLAQNIHPSSGR